MIILNWNTRPDFLLRSLFPKAKVINAFNLDKKSLFDELENYFNRKICIFHINLSVSKNIPKNRTWVLSALEELGFEIINNDVTDIRKSHIQNTLLYLNMPNTLIDTETLLNQKVIVKTNYNYGGISESMLTEKQRMDLGIINSVNSKISSFDQYYTCLLHEISNDTLNDQSLVVEKYIENKSNIFYRFYICGRKMVLSKVVNDNTIKKMLVGLQRTNYLTDDTMNDFDDVKGIILGAQKFCKHIGLRFGAIDIVVDDINTPYIIDVNITPGWGEEDQSEILDHLRQGFFEL